MKPFVPVLMTARERATLLAEFDGTALKSGAASAPTTTAAASTPSGLLGHVKAALAASATRFAEAGARR